MKLITYSAGGSTSVGILREARVTPLNEMLTANGKKAVGSVLELIEATQASPDIMQTLCSADLSGFTSLPLDTVTLLAPVPYPRRNVFCLGKNYAKHATEVKETLLLSNSGVPLKPVYFTKAAAPATAPGGFIEAEQAVTQKVDYESELAVIIGKGGRNIAPQDAESHIFGYTVINDVSARDLQKSHEQWFKGKSLDTFCPMGPCIVSADEIPFPVDLAISCHVNGELRQSGKTNELIFDIPYIISDLSKGLTLLPGDIISTGTPAGVGAGRTPPVFLQNGDVVECTVEKIGTLKNTVKII